MGTDEAMESELGLGELAGLTVANEADSLAYDVSHIYNSNLFFVDGRFYRQNCLIYVSSAEVWPGTVFTCFTQLENQLNFCLF